MRKRLPILPLLVLVLLLANSAFAFDALRTPGGRVVRAPRSPWPVYVQADAIDKLTVKKVQTVTLAAIAAWNAVTDTKIELSYGGLVRQAPHLGVYIWLDRHFAWPNTDGTSRTELEWNDDGGLRQATIALNGVDYQWVTGTAAASGDSRPIADLQSVLTHQLGHALGLAHSHNPLATMYFWGTGRAGRTLTPDDARSLRFVYPATDVTESTTCDPCRSDADCAGTGRCLAWPDGFAYCASPCNTHEDCPIGTSCGAYASGIACLPNDGHCNADRAVDHTGDPCASDAACVDAELCMPIASGQGFCTSGCNSSFDCAAGSTCSPGGFCAAHGPGTDGEVCRVPGDCASAACLASTLRSGSCGRGCSGQCGNSELCGDDGFCRRVCINDINCPDGQFCSGDKVCRGPLPLGWPCASGYDCAAGSCITLSGMRFDAVCTIACDVPTDCPAGSGCSQTSKGKLCIPGSTLTLGSPCASDAACGKGLGCDKAQLWAGYGVCTTACDPFGTSSECQGGWCAWNGDAANARGLCRGTAGGGVQGATCDETNRCRGDLTCAQTEGGARCARSCDLAAPVCDVGLSCIPISGEHARGVCLDGGTSATVLSPVVVKPLVNLDGRTVMLPQVVPVAEFKPVQATANTSQKGCSSGRSAPARPDALVFTLVLGVLTARRLRRN